MADRNSGAPERVCVWTPAEEYDDTVWQTACGDAFVFNDYGPSENHYRFCPACGAALRPAAAANEGRAV